MLVHDQHVCVELSAPDLDDHRILTGGNVGQVQVGVDLLLDLAAKPNSAPLRIRIDSQRPPPLVENLYLSCEEVSSNGDLRTGMDPDDAGNGLVTGLTE